MAGLLQLHTLYRKHDAYQRRLAASEARTAEATAAHAQLETASSEHASQIAALKATMVAHATALAAAHATALDEAAAAREHHAREIDEQRAGHASHLTTALVRSQREAAASLASALETAAAKVDAHREQHALDLESVLCTAAAELEEFRAHHARELAQHRGDAEATLGALETAHAALAVESAATQAEAQVAALNGHRASAAARESELGAQLRSAEETSAAKHTAHCAAEAALAALRAELSAVRERECELSTLASPAGSPAVQRRSSASQIKRVAALELRFDSALRAIAEQSAERSTKQRDACAASERAHSELAVEQAESLYADTRPRAGMLEGDSSAENAAPAAHTSMLRAPMLTDLLPVGLIPQLVLLEPAVADTGGAPHSRTLPPAGAPATPAPTLCAPATHMRWDKAARRPSRTFGGIRAGALNFQGTAPELDAAAVEESWAAAMRNTGSAAVEYERARELAEQRAASAAMLADALVEQRVVAEQGRRWALEQLHTAACAREATLKRAVESLVRERDAALHTERERGIEIESDAVHAEALAVRHEVAEAELRRTLEQQRAQATANEMVLERALERVVLERDDALRIADRQERVIEGLHRERSAAAVRAGEEHSSMLIAELATKLKRAEAAHTATLLSMVASPWASGGAQRYRLKM